MPWAHQSWKSWALRRVPVALLTVALGAAPLGLGGCIAVPVTYATPAADAEAKQFKCPEGMSRVYIFRDEHTHYVLPITLSLDDRPIGDYYGWNYSVFDLPPGSHRLSAVCSQTLAESEMEIETKVGEIDYVWLEKGLLGGAWAREVDERRGQAGVMRSRLITFKRSALPMRGGQGTAWLVSPHHWITNHHVVGDRKSVKLTDIAGNSVEVRVLAVDPANDLAVLVSDSAYSGAVPIPIAPAPPKIGERVVTIGFPLAALMGAKPKLSTGDIAGLEGALGDPRLVQFSAPIQPGNSGGPLLNSSGEAIGVVTSKLNWQLVAKASGELPEGVAYAVKIAYVRPLLEGVAVRTGAASASLTPDSVFGATSAAVFRVEP